MYHLSQFSPLELLLTGTAAATFIVQVLYYRITYTRPYRKSTVRQNALKKDQGEEPRPPLSVIVYANNESHNLKENLPLLLSQDYPKYEIIVVNDGSTDESDDILKLFENDHPHLYHTFVPQESRNLSRRKLSLTIGVKAARYDTLLFTRASCHPLSDKWLASIARNYTTPQTSIVLGFCSYPPAGGFFHRLVSYDNLLTGVQYLSAGLEGHPYSADGKNLSYRKALFYEHKGYSHTIGLQAGDDDLFVNRFATSGNTKVEYAPESITRSAPFDCFAAWREMKASRLSTERYFKGSRLWLYRIEKASAALFLLSSVASIVTGIIYNHLPTATAGFLLYFFLYIIKAVVWEKLAALLRQQTFTAWLPLLEIARLFTSLYMRAYRLFNRRRDYTFNISGK
ncbi:MAG: glycosyltransferase [Tannerellaceae bacterium]|jgi:glycosyltransferase involved in cell wall biosynthesis|nr:glycosyltransferase [Tannerellaceae bacterium]